MPTKEKETYLRKLIREEFEAIRPTLLEVLNKGKLNENQIPNKAILRAEFDKLTAERNGILDEISLLKEISSQSVMLTEKRKLLQENTTKLDALKQKVGVKTNKK
jgi:hypothetical protein